MILLIDNYDSFTYNIVQYLGEIMLFEGKDPEKEIVVKRNDELSVAEVAALNPEKIVISPGPCTPNEAGISVDLIKAFKDKCPILGVCLGHQAIGQAFGADIIRAKKIMHGKTSAVFHDREALFHGIGSPFIATRYHSLVIDRKSLPAELIVTAWTEEDDEIMGVRHRHYPVFGVQFHPESILTEVGKKILKNFLDN